MACPGRISAGIAGWGGAAAELRNRWTGRASHARLNVNRSEPGGTSDFPKFRGPDSNFRAPQARLPVNPGPGASDRTGADRMIRVP
eukprot:749066-Hanusia_phi.AAC.2